MGRRSLGPPLPLSPRWGTGRPTSLEARSTRSPASTRRRRSTRQRRSSSCAGPGSSPGCACSTWAAGLGHVARLVADARRAGRRGRRRRRPARAARDREAANNRGRSSRTFASSRPTSATYTEPGRFDAVVGRLILFHLEDPAAAVRHHAARLERDGVVLAIDFDVGRLPARSLRCESPRRRVDTTSRVLSACGRRSRDRNPPGVDPRRRRARRGVLDRHPDVHRSRRPDRATPAGGRRPDARRRRRRRPASGARARDARAAARRSAAGGRRRTLPPTLVGAWGRRGND